MPRTLVLLGSILACACGGDLTKKAPTELQELTVDGGNVRVVGFGPGIAVAWQHPMTGAGTLARYDEALREVWRVDFGAGQPLAVRAWGERIVSLAGEEVFVFTADGTIAGQWSVPGASDLAVAGQRLLVLTDGGVRELDETGAEIAVHPVDPDFTAGHSLEASAAGYCPFGLIGDDSVTTCFGWDGVKSPVVFTQAYSFLSSERDFAALSDDGIVSALTVSLDGVSAVSQALPDGRFAGQYRFETGPSGHVDKLFLGPEGRVMWLETEEWCDDHCSIGFRVGMLDESRSTAAWRSDLFAVEGVVGNMWTAVTDDDRIYVATDRAVFVVSSG